MPVTVKGGIDLQKALRKFTPDLAKDTRKEMASLLKPIVSKARGFIPSQAPLSGWGKASSNGKFPVWDGRAAKGGVGYKTSPSRPNRQGFRSLARIQNASASGAIYETAGRVHANGREQAKMREVVIPTYRRDTRFQTDPCDQVSKRVTPYASGSSSKTSTFLRLFKNSAPNIGTVSPAALKPSHANQYTSVCFSSSRKAR